MAKLMGCNFFLHACLVTLLFSSVVKSSKAFFKILFDLLRVTILTHLLNDLQSEFQVVPNKSMSSWKVQLKTTMDQWLGFTHWRLAPWSQDVMCGCLRTVVPPYGTLMVEGFVGG